MDFFLQTYELNLNTAVATLAETYQQKYNNYHAQDTTSDTLTQNWIQSLKSISFDFMEKKFTNIQPFKQTIELTIYKINNKQPFLDAIEILTREFQEFKIEPQYNLSLSDDLRQKYVDTIEQKMALLRISNNIATDNYIYVIELFADLVLIIRNSLVFNFPSNNYYQSEGRTEIQSRTEQFTRRVIDVFRSECKINRMVSMKLTHFLVLYDLFQISGVYNQKYLPLQPKNKIIVGKLSKIKQFFAKERQDQSYNQKVLLSFQKLMKLTGQQQVNDLSVDQLDILMYVFEYYQRRM